MVRRAVDTLPATLFEFDADGTYTCVAGGYISLFGITGAQVVGRSVFDFPKFVPGKNMMVRRALAGETVSFNGIWPRGRFMIQLKPRFDAHGRVQAVVGIGLPVAKPAAADKHFEQLLEALRQSEMRFRAMCENAPLGIYVSNPQLELGYVNPALCGILGRRADELLQRAWEQVLQPGERERLHTLFASDGPGSVHEGVLQLTRPDGSTVWTSVRMAEMRDDGERIGYVGTVVDVTQERESQRAITRAQRDLRRVIECNPEGIAVIREQRWIFVNRAFAETLGYACPTELIGRDAGELVHPADRQRALCLEAGLSEPGADAAPRELRYRKAKGEYALMEIRPAALSEFDGAPAMLITARDITERKRLQAQSMVAERLLSMGTLAAGVAHEINNPLGAVISHLEWVEGRLARLPAPQPGAAMALYDEVQNLLKPIAEAREAAGRVRAIVRDLKLFSRAEAELQTRVDIMDVLDSAVRMAWNELRHRARFIRDYGVLPLVEGSEARLGQVFLNLLINAAHAIPEGRADEHEIRLSARALPAQQIVVEVHDTGSGIPADIQARIFDPFFTTKPPGIGTGLGLSICQRIVTEMGGQIDVTSEFGRGTTFRVTLRSIDGQMPAAAETPSVTPHQPGPRGRVLVIDDDPAMGSAIELVLADEHEVEVFTSAKGALARLQGGANYDAIVCDVMMPEMSGADFHSELERTQPQLATQIIFLTGGAFTLRAREFLNRVPNPRLDKPFDSQSLRTLVGRSVARAGETSLPTSA